MRKWRQAFLSIAVVSAVSIGLSGNAYAQSDGGVLPADTLTLLPQGETVVPVIIEEGPTITGTLENSPIDVQGSVQTGPPPVVTHAPTVQDQQRIEAERAALIGKETTRCLNPQAPSMVGNQISVPFELEEGVCQGPTVTSAYFP